MARLKRFHRGEVHVIALDPTRGSEIRKTLPCLVVSPDEMNHHLRTVIIALLTTGGRSYPARVPCTLDGVPGHVALDQLRTVDQQRLLKRLGTIAPEILTTVLAVLRELFEE